LREGRGVEKMGTPSQSLLSSFLEPLRVERKFSRLILRERACCHNPCWCWDSHRSHDYHSFRSTVLDDLGKSGSRGTYAWDRMNMQGDQSAARRPWCRDSGPCNSGRAPGPFPRCFPEDISPGVTPSGGSYLSSA